MLNYAAILTFMLALFGGNKSYAYEAEKSLYTIIMQVKLTSEQSLSEVKESINYLNDFYSSELYNSCTGEGLLNFSNQDDCLKILKKISEKVTRVETILNNFGGNSKVYLDQLTKTGFDYNLNTFSEYHPSKDKIYSFYSNQIISLGYMRVSHGFNEMRGDLRKDNRIKDDSIFYAYRECIGTEEDNTWFYSNSDKVECIKDIFDSSDIAENLRVDQKSALKLIENFVDVLNKVESNLLEVL